MVLVAIDYTSLYFKYKTPILIRGELINKTLKYLKIELWANDSLVETNLGGGNHIYLVLVLRDTKYNAILNTQPFAPPCISTMISNTYQYNTN